MSTEVIRSRAALPPETDLLIVLGKNLGVEWNVERVRDDPDLLSDDSRLNIEAAGELWIPGRLLLLSGGRTIGPDFPSQPEAAQTYLRRECPDIPLHDIRLDETGFDTAASAETIARQVRTSTLKARHIGLISVGYHVENAGRLFRNYGAPIESLIAAEDIVAERSAEDAERIADWRELPRVQEEEKRERIRGIILHVDRKGKLIRTLTRGRVEKAPATSLVYEPQ